MSTAPTAKNKTAYNVAGGIIGVLLALFAIFGLVQSQENGQPQKFDSKISYEG